MTDPQPDSKPELSTGSACCSFPAPRTVQNALDALDEERLAALCKALAHPARVRIVRILLEKQECVCGDLVELLPLSQSTVSEHLRILKEAGLVDGRVDGPRRCYCASSTALEDLKRLIGLL